MRSLSELQRSGCARIVARSLAASALLPSVLGAQAVPTIVERQILAARDTIWQAWFANDTAILNRMLPSASAAGESADTATLRWNDRASILSSARQFASGGGHLERLAFTGTKVTLQGNVAVVTSSYAAVVRSGEHTDTTHGRATEVFARVGTGWVNPFWTLQPARPTSFAREIPLPDTLGANFAIADSASRHGTPEDYDALIGFWEFRFQTRTPNGAFNPAFSGHWSFEKKPGGMLIEDHWRADNPTAPMGVSTYTYRTFNPQRKLWEMVGTTSAGSPFAPGLTWSDDESRYAIQHYGTTIMRIRYFALEPNHFLWRADASTDGGRTWHLDAWTMEAMRIGK